jgi:hypothetical protein
LTNIKDDYIYLHLGYYDTIPKLATRKQRGTKLIIPETTETGVASSVAEINTARINRNNKRLSPYYRFKTFVVGKNIVNSEISQNTWIKQNTHQVDALLLKHHIVNAK